MTYLRFAFDLLFFAFFAGYVWFVSMTPSGVADQTTKTEAIVVLTGASGRIARAVDLLNGGYAQELFISGVDPEENIKTLLKTQGCEEVSCQRNVRIGAKARSTVGNAIETLRWIQTHNIHSIRLVTSALHMRRTLLEFKRIAPHLHVIPHPVNIIAWQDLWKTPKLIRLTLLEYTKYLMALLHIQRLFRRNLSEE